LSDSAPNSGAPEAPDQVLDREGKREGLAREAAVEAHRLHQQTEGRAHAHGDQQHDDGCRQDHAGAALDLEAGHQRGRRERARFYGSAHWQPRRELILARTPRSSMDRTGAS
jgi:hypothetical protein